ncbi:hypothetical protein PoB_003035500 [Plakobranchus ocellatus]|uniref:Uncharacterized protein n=1 Tax=Plakobranchus ocellatus TaxID=259542 RepID=A0AAV4A6Q2_9GAST|nr:hypothetical protein PoB_003035500 [Plakobranchus ocellatus]
MFLHLVGTYTDLNGSVERATADPREVRQYVPLRRRCQNSKEGPSRAELASRYCRSRPKWESTTHRKPNCHNTSQTNVPSQAQRQARPPQIQPKSNHYSYFGYNPHSSFRCLTRKAVCSYCHKMETTK